MNTRAGFSLIELLAVVAITALLSIVTVQIVVSSQLRASQTEGVSKIRREADFVLDQMSFTIRNARSVSCLSPTQIQVMKKDNTTILYALQDMRLASNSAFLTSTGIEVSGVNFACTNNDSSPGTLVDIYFTLTNTAVTPPFGQGFNASVYLRPY